MATVNSSEIPRLQETPGIQVKLFEGIASQGLQFNCANEYTKSPLVRQAISYAIDRQLIIDTLYSDIGEKACLGCVIRAVANWSYELQGFFEEEEKRELEDYRKEMQE